MKIVTEYKMHIQCCSLFMFNPNENATKTKQQATEIYGNGSVYIYQFVYLCVIAKEFKDNSGHMFKVFGKRC